MRLLALVYINNNNYIYFNKICASLCVIVLCYHLRGTKKFVSSESSLVSELNFRAQWCSKNAPMNDQVLQIG